MKENENKRTRVIIKPIFEQTKYIRTFESQLFMGHCHVYLVLAGNTVTF